MLEALLVEQGARVEFEPYDAARADRSTDASTCASLPTITIDPETAKDFDDALSFRREPDGIRAWVHIADVSAFVPAGSPLDRGAAERALSTYVPGSSRRCSRTSSPTTRARCARTRTASASRSRCRRAGEPLFYRSVISSDARLTYGRPSAARRRRRSSSSST